MFFKSKLSYHNRLAPQMWDLNNRMFPHIRTAIIGIFNQILSEIKALNIPFDMSDVHDIFIHGSMTNYYYDAKSDIDICVVCDFTRISRALPGVNVCLVLKTIAKATFAHMLPFVIGRKIDISFVDVYHPKYAPGYYKVGGAYSLLADKWIRENIRLTKSELKQMRNESMRIYHNMVKLLMNLLHTDVSVDHIEKTLEQLMNNRRVEYDTHFVQPLTPNLIAFRMARSSGLMRRAAEWALKLRAQKPQ